MMLGTIILTVVVVALIGVGLFIWRRRRPVELTSTEPFQEKWLELQKLLRDKARWGEAILAADTLLDEALKKKHLSGRSMGERLVKAQRLFSDNDSLWFAHKLRTQLDGDPT